MYVNRRYNQDIHICIDEQAIAKLNLLAGAYRMRLFFKELKILCGLLRKALTSLQLICGKFLTKAS
jgi:hypothetical protein